MWNPSAAASSSLPRPLLLVAAGTRCRAKPGRRQRRRDLFSHGSLNLAWADRGGRAHARGFPWCACESTRGARRRPSASGGGRWTLGGAPACAGGGGPCARSAAPSLTRTARGMAAARRGRRSGCGGAGGSLICRCSRVLPGGAGGDGGPCTRVGSLRTDLGENLPSASAKAGGGGAICVVPFLKASPWRSSRPLSATSGGNPRSDDRMTAALWCRSSLGGVILGGTHVIEGPEDGFFGGAVIHPTH